MSKRIPFLAAISLLTVFIIDANSSTEFVFDILYLCSILLVFKQNIRTIIIFSVITCLLILITVLIADHSGKLTLSVWVNRVISILAILITSYLAIHSRKLSEKAVNKQKQYAKALESMLFITSHQVRKPVANIIGLVDIIDQDDEISITDFKAYNRYLRASADELDGFVKELNAFIRETEEVHNKA